MKPISNHRLLMEDCVYENDTVSNDELPPDLFGVSAIAGDLMLEFYI
ncbi:MAG: hypothetical protein ACOYMA_19735 [Bacteroidia bacterium]